MSQQDRPPQSRPGVVLGPDGKPCRVCTAFRAWKPVKKKTAQAETAAKLSAAKDSALAAFGVAQTLPLAKSQPRDACPPDGEQLGRATWTFLHTTAAYYPERPDPLQQRHMHCLLNSLPTLYPCSHCATHLGERMKIVPPDVSSRGALSRWLCDRHNEVNEMLGKEKFDCAKTDERWRDGPSNGSCD